MTQAEDEKDEEWCERCMEVVEVADRFDDVIQEYAGQRGVRVTEFFCGHNISVPDGTFYPFP